MPLAERQAFSVVLNPGDPVLIETPVYAGILPPLKNLQAKTIGRRPFA
jgi:tryptophan aminotransferase